MPGECGPYDSSWCYHAPTCHVTTPSVHTECDPDDEPPCTDCKEEHRLSVQALKAVMPENC